MARQTRRKRDSKSNNRFRTRLATTSPSDRGLSGGKDSKLGLKSSKTDKVNWTTVLALVAIFIFSLYIRTAWTLEPATEDGFQLTGGSDPYYHKRVVDYVAENGEHLDRDPMLNYPYGANNNRPPLFDWSIAIIGLALSPFFSSSEESVWWAMEVLPAIYGAMIIFPVYAIGKSQFGKEAGFVGAFLIGVNSGHINHSTLGLADHDSYIILFGTTAYFFFMKALTVSNDKKWVSNWRDFEEIKKGFSNFVSSEKLALGYAGLTGITITMIAMSWKGFPYIMAIIAIYLGFQMLINAFRRIDSLTTAMLGVVALAMPVLLSYPYYNIMGFVGTWWEAPAYILLGYILFSLLMVTTRDLPWLLVIGSSIGIASGIYLLLTYVFTELGFLLFSGQGYFVRTKLFNTIAEAQAPKFSDFVFDLGVITIWLALFGIVWMAYQLYNQSIWKKDYLFVMVWAVVSIYMAQSAVRFIFNATPVVSLISGWITWLIIDWANFSAVLATWKASWGKRGGTFLGLSILSLIIGFWLFFTVSVLIGLLSAIILITLIMVIGHMDAQDDDQYRFRDRISGLRKGIELKRTFVVLFVGLFIFLPNTFYGYDAGVPFEDKKEHDVNVYDFLSYDFFRPMEYDSSERTNTTMYPEGVAGMYNTTNNDLWYMGNSGSSFPYDYWMEGLGWLAEQDTELAPEERPGFMAWWDYGFWAIDIGEHPTVADNFQFGYQIAGNFIASQSEEEAMALLLYRLLEPEVNRDTNKFSNEVRTELLNYYSEENITELENIVSNPEDYIPKKDDGTDQEVHKKNAAIRAGKPILMTLEKSDISDILWEIEEITGKSIRYFAADQRLLAISAQQPGILYAPVTLADYDMDNFHEMQLVLSNGQVLPEAEAIEVLQADPSIRFTDYKLVFKEKYLNSMFFRSYVGWSALDIGRPIEDGVPGISGTIGQDQSLPSLPGWNLTHFKLVHINSGLRILKYYDGATLYGTVTTPDGSPIANANVTVSDEYKIPHNRVTTNEKGEYSLIAPAGNLTLAVSIGNLESDIEKVMLVSNNVLVTKDNIIVSEDQAMRRTGGSEIKIDLEVEAASVSGRLFWDNNKDNAFDSNDEAIPLTPVTATNIRSNEVDVVNTDANGNYQLLGLAPGEYEITTVINGHDVELASYVGKSALMKGQDIPESANQGPGALEAGKIWGRVTVGNVDSEMVTITLYDETNNSIIETSFMNSYHFSSTCSGNIIDSSISYCFDKLLPGNYTMRFESDSTYTGWTNNTQHVELGKGSSKSFNSTLLKGFRVEGTLSHNDNAIANEQISFRNLNGLYSDNVFTTDSGYFATVLTAGTYNVYTTHNSEGTTLAYLNRIDSDTYSSNIVAAMGPGHTIEGTLFGDLDGNGIFNEEKGEIAYPQTSLTIDSESGSVSTTTTFGGKYQIILPEGDYNAYSIVESGNGQKLVSLSNFQVIGDRENLNLSTSLGHDVMIILYEEYLDEIITLEGLVKFSSTVADIGMWATDPSTMQTFPEEEYDVTLEKFGYTLHKMYLGPDEVKTPITQLDMPIEGGANELLLVAKRIPTSIDGTFVYDGTPIPNAEISFTPMDHPSFNLNFTTDSNGDFEDVMLPPDNYMYTVTLDDAGSRYYVSGQIIIPMGTPSIDMGELTAELRYRVSGDIALDGNAKTGIVQFTPIDDFGNITNVESTPFGAYSEYLFPGNYYVTFQDGLTSKHYSYGGLLELTESSAVHPITLLNQGHVKGKVTSQADDTVITERSVRIQFISDEGIVFIANTNADEGYFGTDDNYGKIDLPNGDYDVIVNEDGYQDFTSSITIAGANPTYNDIVLTPKTVNVTISINYINATGSTTPLSNAEVVFEASSSGSFALTTNEDGQIIISDMVPRQYNLEMDITLNDGADEFKMSKNLNVKPGKEQQTFTKNANWKVRVSGTIFYDRDLNGIADSNELLGNSQVEIWNIQGDLIDETTTSDSDGSYQIYLNTGSYQTWFYNTEETSYVSIDALELEEAINLDASLTRGVNYIVTYQSNDTSEDIDFANVDVNGKNFTFEFDVEDSGIGMVVPSGNYTFESEYKDLEAPDDYIYVLDLNVDITDSLDGVAQTEFIDSELMRGIEVDLDMNNYEIPLGQSAIFTFNVTSTGSFDIVLETDTGSVPANWTAAFEPNKISLNPDDNNKPVVLSITPNENIVPGVWEVFNVKIMWSDGDDNDVDDITRSFEITVYPIEQPKPDFTILDNDFTWSPGAPSVGDQVTLTATISNLVNHSGVHSVPVVFYANDIEINSTTAEFDGSGNEVTVTAVWTATSGMHYLKVEINPENVIDETDNENNKATTAFSIEEKEEANDNSILKMAALVVLGLVGGLVYVTYRSRR